MAQTIKYIGNQDNWFEVAVTGKQSCWQVGQQEERSDAEAALLLATGLFYSAPEPVMAYKNLTGGGAILQSGGKNLLSLMYADVTASKTLALADAGQVLKCNSASDIVLTIPNDATGLWEGNDGIAAYQAGAGAVSFAAGAGVTLRGTAPTAAQYTFQGVLRVGVNEWAYL